MNSQLQAFYQSVLPQLTNIVGSASGISQPHLIKVPAAYTQISVKLMIVGQHTRGWGPSQQVPMDVDALMAMYDTFDLGYHYEATPFWGAAHQISRNVNRLGPCGVFLWSNLVKVDQNGGRPDPQIESDVGALGLLQQEIAITMPDGIFFLTGPQFRSRMDMTFPGLGRCQVASQIAQLTHQRLPPCSFETYHPGFLKRSRQWDVLNNATCLLLQCLHDN